MLMRCTSLANHWVTCAYRRCWWCSYVGWGKYIHSPGHLQSISTVNKHQHGVCRLLLVAFAQRGWNLALISGLVMFSVCFQLAHSRLAALSAAFLMGLGKCLYFLASCFTGFQGDMISLKFHRRVVSLSC